MNSNAILFYRITLFSRIRDVYFWEFMHLEFLIVSVNYGHKKFINVFFSYSERLLAAGKMSAKLIN